MGERVCPVCGKRFLLPVSNLYKLTIRGKVEHYCSYTCYMAKKREKEGSKKSSTEV